MAGLFRRDFPAKPYFSTTSHPGMIAHRLRSGRWRCVRRPGLTTAHGRVAGGGNLSGRAAVDRISAGFEYVGPPAASD